MAKDLIVAQHHPRAHIGDWRERGRDHQIRQIVNAVENDDAFVVVADVVRAFPSVNVDTIYELPYLPEALIRRAIDYRFLRFSRGYVGACPWDELNLMHGELEMAPSGLLEGSPVSNALFSVLLDDLPDHLDECISAFVYCDNVILVAPTEEQAQNAARSLVRYFSGHRAGPFEVRSEVRKVRYGFDHLGYSLYCRGNEVEVDLSPASWKRLLARIQDQEASCAETLRWLHTSYGALTQGKINNWVTLILGEEMRRRDGRSPASHAYCDASQTLSKRNAEKADL
ncbi:hypothetical protein [Qipengyuania sp. NPDC077563]|uniref:hypothetical protein n=1 Tax=Qipengyuania sp. NPDC077563 TaxID=3364497 RepID=UPI00384D8D27